MFSNKICKNHMCCIIYSIDFKFDFDPHIFGFIIMINHYHFIILIYLYFSMAELIKSLLNHYSTNIFDFPFKFNIEFIKIIIIRKQNLACYGVYIKNLISDIYFPL